MATQIFRESGQDGRSVLGMVAVQVEKDPKTGATVVRSVAPVSAPVGTERTHTIFDDGRKSIHAVGASEGQPSSEELGQILSAIDGVGMKALLDDVTVVPSDVEFEAENVVKFPFSTQCETRPENVTQLEVSAENIGGRSGVSAGDVIINKANNDGVTAFTVEDIDAQKLEDGPVTLVFLGYTDAAADQGQEGEGGMVTVERVMITDDGEEYVIGGETAPLSPPSLTQEEAEKVSQHQELLDVPLDRAEVKDQRGEDDQETRKQSLPREVKGKSTSKPKTCQCCSVM